MRATSEELALVYTHQLFSSQLASSPLFFPSSPILSPISCIGKKRSFEKAFDIKNWPWAKDYTGEEMDLSFADYHCPVAIKANRA